MLYKNVLLCFVLILQASVFILFPAAGANAKVKRSLNPLEQGAYSAFATMIGRSVSELRWVKRSLKDKRKRTSQEWLSRYPSSGWTVYKERKLRKRQCDVVRAWVKAGSRWNPSKKLHGRTIHTPHSVNAFVQAVVQARNKVYSLNFNGRCDHISDADLFAVSQLTDKVRIEQSALNTLFKNRRRSKSWSNTFSVELYPIPLRIEFIEGSAKLKMAGTLGPLRWTGMSGQSFSATRYNGLAYLVFLAPEGWAYVFDIRGIDFDLKLPEALLEFRGASLYVSCSTACVDNIRWHSTR